MKNSPHAFPSELTVDRGMTLRDYFAAKVLQGLATRGIEDEVKASQWCYEIADAMLEARKQ